MIAQSAQAWISEIFPAGHYAIKSMVLIDFIDINLVAPAAPFGPVVQKATNHCAVNSLQASLQV